MDNEVAAILRWLKQPHAKERLSESIGDLRADPLSSVHDINVLRAMRSALGGRAATRNVQERRAQALRLLKTKGGMSTTELGRHLGVSERSVSLTLARSKEVKKFRVQKHGTVTTRFCYIGDD